MVGRAKRRSTGLRAALRRGSIAFFESPTRMGRESSRNRLDPFPHCLGKSAHASITARISAGTDSGKQGARWILLRPGERRLRRDLLGGHVDQERFERLAGVLVRAGYVLERKE